MVMPAGARTETINFERLSTIPNQYGEEVEDWTAAGIVRAAVFWGSGQERRAAAAESASQAASFVVLTTAMTSSIGVSDRIVYMNAPWDIESIVKRGRRELEFNARRAR